MVEQLFTATGEDKGNGQERRERLFTARKEIKRRGREGEGA
jgi:hypothetical protein